MTAETVATRGRRLLRGSGTGWDWLQLTALGLVLAGFVVFGGMRLAPLLRLEDYDYLAGAAALLGAAALVFVLAGSSHLILALFVAVLVLGHQFYSPIIIEFANIEWHPRELVLFLLIAHFLVKLVLGRLKIQPDLMHYFFYLYCFYFVLIGSVGVWYQRDIQEIIEEIRFPIFLATYFIFVSLGVSRRALGVYMGGILIAATLIAAAASAFFVYTMATGFFINVQGFLGEYVPRMIGPLMVQNVRPNGHMFFEVCTVVLLSLIFCRGVHWWAKIIYLALVALFLFAIAITMMRTAYVALFCSLAMLVFLSLPQNLKVIGIFVVLLGSSAVALFFGLQLYEQLGQIMPELGVSLQARFEETRGALLQFTNNPLMGAGMGSSFDAFGWVAKTSSLSYGRAQFQTVHNLWVYYLFKGGIIGMMIVLVALGGVFARGYWFIERVQDVRERFLLRGLVAATGGQMVASLAIPRLQYPQGVVFLAMMCAAFVIIYHHDRKRQAS